MPTKKKAKIYKDVVYDSKEEIEFKIFLEEAKEHGLVKSYIYQPPSYVLIPKATYIIKGKEKTLFREHSYTADWLIYPTELFESLNHKLKRNKDGSYLIDVKGTYNANGGDRIFPIHQKLLYFTKGIIVNKVVPKLFFQDINLAPEGLRWNKAIKKEKVLNKAFKGLNSFEEFLSQYKDSQITGKQINLKILN